MTCLAPGGAPPAGSEPSQALTSLGPAASAAAAQECECAHVCMCARARVQGSADGLPRL